MDVTRSLADAVPAVYWSDSLDEREPAAELRDNETADLVVVGAGLSGLWAALQAAERDPQRKVVVVEGETVGFGASSRNGGFLEASLTHGVSNGVARWPEEMPILHSLGMGNFEDILATIRARGLDVDLEVTGATAVATAPWQLEELDEAADLERSLGSDVEMFDRADMRARVHSPTYLGGLFVRDGTAIVHPAKLCRELARACGDLGVTFHERSPVTGFEDGGASVVVKTDNGSIRAEKVIVATNAYKSPVRRMRRYIVPVYDYVLMTEPLSEDRMGEIGWAEREGLSDSANQFHYYRLTADNRILWGGYDAVYRYNSAVGDQYEQAGGTHELLARHFFETFPQLEGVRFTHRWAGPIGTTTQFTATWGTEFDGRLAWVGGYTGLGVAATRFGAGVALDLVDSIDSTVTDLTMVRRPPMAFPPEPFRYLGIQLTRKAIASADAHGGKRNLWLRALDAFGVGFDS